MLAATRIGDLELVHCTQPARAQGYFNCIISGSPASRVGDLNIPHLRPGSPCPTHVFPMLTGAPNIIVGGCVLGSVGSITCTFAIQGSPNVFVQAGNMSYENADLLSDDIVPA